LTKGEQSDEVADNQLEKPIFPRKACGRWKENNPEFFMQTRLSPIPTAIISVFALCLATLQADGAGLPSATTLGTSNITSSSVRVFGQVNPNGVETFGYFQLGTTTNYGNSTPTFDAGNGTGQTAALADFFGLSASTLYHYRVVATNSFGTSFGLDATFTTAVGSQSPPTATTLGASNITTTTVKIYGSINPNGTETMAYFEIGTTTTYGRSTSTLDAGNGTFTATANADFNGLFPGMVYHYRVVGYNSFGTNFGQDATFTTLAGLPITPTAVDTNVLAPGHFVQLRQAAPAFGSVTNITAAEALLNLASTNSEVAFDAYDVGIATVNYADFVTSPPPQGSFGLDRDIHVIPGNIAPDTNEDNYAMEMTGYIYIPQAGSWTFYVNSDEGFRLRMGASNDVVMEFPGTRTPATSSGVVSVPSAGYYPYLLTYFELTGGSEVEFFAAAPGQQTLTLVGDFISPLAVYHQVEAPLLSIASQPGQVVISWPVKFGSGTLQSNTNLASSASWGTVGPPSVTGGQYVVTNSVSMPALFYRLQLP
jgi:hypothetical protein